MDLNDLDKGQILMARQPGQSIFEAAGLAECSQCTMYVPAKSGPRRDNQWTGNRVMGARGCLMCTVSEGWPIWSDPTEELLLHKLLKSLMRNMIENCRDPVCIKAC